MKHPSDVHRENRLWGPSFGDCPAPQYVSKPSACPQTHCSSQAAPVPSPGQSASLLPDASARSAPSLQAAGGIFSKPKEDHIFPLLKILPWLPAAHRKMPHSTLWPPRSDHLAPASLSILLCQPHRGLRTPAPPNPLPRLFYSRRLSSSGSQLRQQRPQSSQPTPLEQHPRPSLSTVLFPWSRITVRTCLCLGPELFPQAERRACTQGPT